MFDKQNSWKYTLIKTEVNQTFLKLVIVQVDPKLNPKTGPNVFQPQLSSVKLKLGLSDFSLISDLSSHQVQPGYPSAIIQFCHQS